MSAVWAILCILQNLLGYFEKALIYVINETILAVAAICVVLFSLFPAMPDLPTWEGGSLSIQLLNWIAPMAAYLALWGVIIEIMLIIFVVRIAAKWAKLL